MGDWSEQLASWSREPQAWIVGAAVLFGVAVVLLLLAAVAAWRARRRRRRLPAVPDDGSDRLLAALVTDPAAARAALEQGDEPCTTAVALLRAGVPVAAVARLTGIEVSDLGDHVATHLGVLEPR